MDVYNVEFYKASLYMIKEDVIKAIESFFISHEMILDEADGR